MSTAFNGTTTPRARRLRGQAGNSRWDMAMRAPAAPLRPYVRGDYVGYTEWTRSTSVRREFPSPIVVAIIEFGPPVRIREADDPRRLSSHRGGFVGGLSDAYADCEHDGFQQGVQINLTGIGARLLFGIPMSEISGRIVPIRDLLPARHRNLGDRLQDVPGWDERFDLLDAALADCLHEGSAHTRAVSWAVNRIEETGGSLDIRSLAHELGYSRQRVIALFRDQVGIPPKLLARIVRFDRLLQRLRGGSRETWADLALDLGFYDQAHLVRDVRHFSGLTPTQVRPLATDIEALLT